MTLGLHFSIAIPHYLTTPFVVVLNISIICVIKKIRDNNNNNGGVALYIDAVVDVD